MCDFRPGDFIECIDDRPVRAESAAMPVKGELYTAETIRHVAGGHSVRLKELTPTCYRGGPCACGNCGWDAARFRKIYRPEPHKIAMLTALLKIEAPCEAC